MICHLIKAKSSSDISEEFWNLNTVYVSREEQYISDNVNKSAKSNSEYLIIVCARHILLHKLTFRNCEPG